MTNRLKIILVVGVIAIALTYLLTRTPEPTVSDADYEKQLQEIRNKQKQKSQRVAPQAIPSPSTPQTASAETTTGESPALPFQGKEPTDAESQQRLAYLSTLPNAVIEATHRDEASASARLDAGRVDPFAPISPSSFPKGHNAEPELHIAAGKKLPEPELGNGPDGLPPPPPGAESLGLPGMPAGKHAPDTAPDIAPPPPDTTSTVGFDELPPPPEKTLLMTKMKLNGVVGDRAILTFKDKRFQRRHNLKNFITLSPGQEFDSVTLLKVEDHKVILQEDGQTASLELDPIR